MIWSSSDINKQLNLEFAIIIPSVFGNDTALAERWTEFAEIASQVEDSNSQILKQIKDDVPVPNFPQTLGVKD